MALEPAHFEDRLMTTLLAEEIGHEDCPDLAASILREAFPTRWTIDWRLGSAVAAAAVLTLAVILWPKPQAVYTPIEVVGQITVEGGGPLQRGSYVQAPSAPAQLVLGGCGRVEMAAGTRLQVLGEEKNEAVELLEGRVICQVDSGVGRFGVSTPLGMVEVKGTQFSVELSEEHSEQLRTKQGESAMIKQQMWVRVLSGVVVLSGLMGEPQELRAGDEQKITGGTVTGTVIEKGKNLLVLRVGEGEKTVELFPRWIGGETGGLEERMLKMFDQVPVGSVIKARVAYDERLRALDLRIVKLGEGRRENEKADEPDLETPPKTREEQAREREAEKREIEHREGEKREGERREGDKPRDGVEKPRHEEGDKPDLKRPEAERKEGDRPLPPPVRREGEGKEPVKERPAAPGEADRIEARVHELKRAIELGRQKVREAAKAGRERDAEKIERQVHELEKEVEALMRRLRETEAARKEAPKREIEKREPDRKEGADSEKARRIRELEKQLEELKRSDREKPEEKREEFKPVRK